MNKSIFILNYCILFFSLTISVYPQSPYPQKNYLCPPGIKIQDGKKKLQPSSKSVLISAVPDFNRKNKNGELMENYSISTGEYSTQGYSSDVQLPIKECLELEGFAESQSYFAIHESEVLDFPKRKTVGKLQQYENTTASTTNAFYILMETISSGKNQYNQVRGVLPYEQGSMVLQGGKYIKSLEKAMIASFIDSNSQEPVDLRLTSSDHFKVLWSPKKGKIQFNVEYLEPGYKNKIIIKKLNFTNNGQTLAIDIEDRSSEEKCSFLGEFSTVDFDQNRMQFTVSPGCQVIED